MYNANILTNLEPDPFLSGTFSQFNVWKQSGLNILNWIRISHRKAECSCFKTKHRNRSKKKQTELGSLISPQNITAVLKEISVNQRISWGRFWWSESSLGGYCDRLLRHVSLWFPLTKFILPCNFQSRREALIQCMKCRQNEVQTVI